MNPELSQLPDAIALDETIGKLGKHILFSRRKVLAEARESLSRINSKFAGLRRFDLVSAALNANANQSHAIQDFISLMDVNFREFTEREPALNDIIAYHGLKQMLVVMERYATCPLLHNRTIGSIGGGFSSGKSAFINSLLSINAGVKLAEGIRPVTAIPSFVLHSTQADIQGINKKGASFNIDLDIYSEISHELLKAIPYLRDIVPYIIVSAPMSSDTLDNLAFIDTPGYNPSAVGLAENDPETAREYLKDASFLIWMVGLDSNGTIPQSDIEFLYELGFGHSEERQLYVVANKAELKTASDIENILDTFVECLEDSGLEYAGITAYSSRMKKGFSSRGKELFDFLAENNIKREHYGNLIKDLCDVFRPYVEEIYRDNHEKNQYRKATHDLLLEALKTGVIDASTDSHLEQGLLALEKNFTHSEKLDERIDRAKTLFNRFVQCIEAFGEEVGMERMDVSCWTKNLFSNPLLNLADLNDANFVEKRNSEKSSTTKTKYGEAHISGTLPVVKNVKTSSKRMAFAFSITILTLVSAGVWFYLDSYGKPSEKVAEPLLVTPSPPPATPPPIPENQGLEDGFVKIKDPVVASCTDAKITAYRSAIGNDAIVTYATYNEFAVSCGFNIAPSPEKHPTQSDLQTDTAQKEKSDVAEKTESATKDTKIQLITSMLRAAARSDWDLVDTQSAQLNITNIPAERGDRKIARSANTEGLQALQQKDIPTAVAAFTRGIRADASDIEIRNNLGYAYIQAKDFSSAVNTLLDVLSVAPERSSAWANLSDAFSQSGIKPAAEASLRLSVRYSTNRQKTTEFLQKTATSHESADFRGIAEQVLREMDFIPQGPGAG